MQFRRLSALIGLVLILVISITVPAPAQKPGKNKDGKAGKLTNAKLPKGKGGIARETSGITPNVTDCPTKVPITGGQTINGTLTTSDCTLQDGTFYDEYTFTANAGQQLSISMSASTPGFDTYLILLNPNNTPAAENDDGGGGPEGTDSRIPAGSGVITVSQTGTYSILANGFDSGDTGNYSVTLTTSGGGPACPPAATPITNGQTLNGTLASGDCSLSDNSRYDLYSFTANSGDQVAITMTGTAPVDAYLILVTPDGTTLAENNDGAGGTNARIPPIAGAFGVLPATGTYTIYANSNLANQFGSYSISLNFSGSSCPDTPITLGQTINGTLGAGDCRLPEDGSFLDAYSFNGTAGQQIVITQNSTAFDAFLILISPTGSLIAGDDNSGGGTNARIAFTLPTAGEYIIVANTLVATGTGPYSVTLSQGAVAATIQLAFTAYAIGEGGGAASVGVTRTGDIAQPASVDYKTSDPSGLNNCSFLTGNASARCDYIESVGTVRFAAGQGSKNISIPVVDDSYAEGNETFTITLSNAIGATLGSPNTATVTIQDNEAVNGANPIDGTPFFVRQNYLDFLNREPDPPGSAAWQAVINNCLPGDTSCDRIHVSSSFFRSPEFQGRGYFVYRFYPVAFGRKPDYVEFTPDIAKVSGFLSDAELEAAKVAFITEFMSRPAFINTYNGLDNTQYVDTLLATAGVAPHQFRDFWIAALGNGTRTRAQVLRDITESPEVYNKYYNQAFVVMQYFGYLRRDPDALYTDWIAVLNSSGDYRGMIFGFMNSLEYRFRFGP